MSASFQIRKARNVYYDGYTFAYTVCKGKNPNNRYRERHTFNMNLTSAIEGLHVIWCCLHSSALLCSDERLLKNGVPTFSLQS